MWTSEKDEWIFGGLWRHLMVTSVVVFIILYSGIIGGECVGRERAAVAYIFLS